MGPSCPTGWAFDDRWSRSGPRDVQGPRGRPRLDQDRFKLMSPAWGGVRLAVAILMQAPGSTGRATVPDSELARYARAVWMTTGRVSIGANSGLRPGAALGTWTVNGQWVGAQSPANYLYSIQPVVDGGLALAEVTGERDLIEDVAAFYLALLPRFVPHSELTGSALGRATPDHLVGGGASSRTMQWRDPRGRPGECLLCNAQFLAPAAHLTFLIARMPSNTRGPSAVGFLASYVPLLKRDHLLRMAYQARWGGEAKPGLVALWEDLDAGRRPPGARYLSSLRDRDLWLLASAADLLRAAAVDPYHVALGTAADSLRRFVREGSKRLQASESAGRQPATGVANAAAPIVFFAGDFDEHPDHRYADVTTSARPSGRVPSPRGTSWDVSHLSRLPTVLRRLFEARSATGAAYPDAATLRGAAQQFLGSVWNGDTLSPLLHNYFDGRDGWYRVSDEGRPDFGFPPSTICVSGRSTGGCVGSSGILGWMQLQCEAPELSVFGRAMLRLAASTAVPDVRFRDVKYTLYHQHFAFADTAGIPVPSLLLFELSGDVLLGHHC